METPSMFAKRSLLINKVGVSLKIELGSSRRLLRIDKGFLMRKQGLEGLFDLRVVQALRFQEAQKTEEA